MILLFKAAGGPPLFPELVRIKGYGTKRGVYVAPHTAVRLKAPDGPDLFSVRAPAEAVHHVEPQPAQAPPVPPKTVDAAPAPASNATATVTVAPSPAGMSGPMVVVARMPQISVKSVKDGVYVSFGYDRSVVDSLKQTFSAARWVPELRSWKIPGKTAEKRVSKWVESLQIAAVETAADEDVARRRVQSEIAAGTRQKARGVEYTHDGVILRFPRDLHLIEQIKKIPGSTWKPEAKVWSVPYRSVTSLDPVLPAIAARLDAEDRAAAKRAAEAKAVQAEQMRSRQEAAEAREKARAKSSIFLAGQVRVGDVVRPWRGGPWVVATGIGKVFRLDEDRADAMNALGMEGERVQYVYWRDATPEEAAARQAQADEAQAKADRIKAAKARLSALAAMAREEGEYPKPQPTADGAPGRIMVEGERLIDADPHTRLYGGGSWWVAAPDGLWYIQNNGSDGADWSANNVRTGGAGAIGYRMPRSPEIEAELRSIATILEAK